MKKSKMFRSRHVILGMAALVLAGCTSDNSSEEASGETLESMDPVVLKVSDIGAENGTTGLALKAFMDEVRERTGGKVDFEPYYSSSLHPGAEGLSAIESGLTDIAFLQPSYFVEELPVLNWTTNLGAATIGSIPHDTAAGSVAYQSVIESSDEIAEEFAAHGAMPLITWSSTPPTLLCTEPVESLKQAEGLNTRTGGPPWSDEVAALGMTSVFLDNSEMYEGLQRGVVDCVTNTRGAFMTLGLWEVADHYVPAQLNPYTGSGYMMRQATWNGLPKEVQDIITEAKPLITSTFLSGNAASDAEFVEQAPGKNVKFSDANELNEELGDVQKARIAALVDSAPKSVKDPEALIADFQDTFDEWVTKIEDGYGLPQRDIAQWQEGIIAARDDFPWETYSTDFADHLAGIDR